MIKETRGGGISIFRFLIEMYNTNKFLKRLNETIISEIMLRSKIKQFCTPENIYLFVITVVGGLLRLLAFHYNDIPHGDIHLDYAAGWGFMKTGKLYLPVIAIRPYVYDQLEMGIPLDQHAPLWPLLGGLIAKIVGDVFVAFKFISLFAGIVIIPASYLAFQKSFDKKSALLASTCITFTYILVDYSGNGSLYMLNSLLYVFLIICFQSNRNLNRVLVGIVLGLLYLLNYQSIVAVLALVLIYIIMWRSKGLLRESIISLGISLACSFLIILRLVEGFV